MTFQFIVLLNETHEKSEFEREKMDIEYMDML